MCGGEPVKKSRHSVGRPGSRLCVTWGYHFLSQTEVRTGFMAVDQILPLATVLFGLEFITGLSYPDSVRM